MTYSISSCKTDGRMDAEMGCKDTDIEENMKRQDGRRIIINCAVRIRDTMDKGT